MNFGHTIGHAVESLALNSSNSLLHGEAIAIGMICESWLSHKMVGLPLQSVEKIANFILKFYEFFLLNKDTFPDLIHLMTKDKKNENEQINFSLINPIGTVLINQVCEASVILESLNFYNQLVKN